MDWSCRIYKLNVIYRWLCCFARDTSRTSLMNRERTTWSKHGVSLLMGSVGKQYRVVSSGLMLGVLNKDTRNTDSKQARQIFGSSVRFLYTRQPASQLPSFLGNRKFRRIFLSHSGVTTGSRRGFLSGEKRTTISTRRTVPKSFRTTIFETGVRIPPVTSFFSFFQVPFFFCKTFLHTFFADDSSVVAAVSLEKRGK